MILGLILVKWVGHGARHAWRHYCPIGMAVCSDDTQVHGKTYENCAKWNETATHCR